MNIGRVKSSFEDREEIYFWCGSNGSNLSKFIWTFHALLGYYRPIYFNKMMYRPDCISDNPIPSKNYQWQDHYLERTWWVCVDPSRRGEPKNHYLTPNVVNFCHGTAAYLSISVFQKSLPLNESDNHHLMVLKKMNGTNWIPICPWEAPFLSHDGFSGFYMTTPQIWCLESA